MCSAANLGADVAQWLIPAVRLRSCLRDAQGDVPGHHPAAGRRQVQQGQEPHRRGNDAPSKRYCGRAASLANRGGGAAAAVASTTQQQWDRFADHALEGKSASDLRKLVAEARKLAERERAELEAIHTALVSDYANVKVRLAQAEYDKDRIRLERIRAAQQVAQLKLKVMEQQQLITKLEARHAGGKRT